MVFYYVTVRPIHFVFLHRRVFPMSVMLCEFLTLFRGLTFNQKNSVFNSRQLTPAKPPEEGKSLKE